MGGTPQTQFNIEVQRNVLFQDGDALRTRISAEIHDVQINRSWLSTIAPNYKIGQHESVCENLRQDYLTYEAQVANFIQNVATIRVLNGVPVGLNDRIYLAIRVSEVSNLRDSTRSLLEQLNGVLKARRDEANTKLSRFVNVIFLVVALVSLGIAFTSYIEAQRTRNEQAQSNQAQQRALDSSTEALEAAADSLGQVKKTLDRTLTYTRAQFTVITEQLRLQLERPDLKANLVYPGKLSIIVENLSKTKTAREVIYESRFWNLDNVYGDRLQFVSSPASSMENIPPERGKGPYPLKLSVSESQVPLKIGDRLFGYVSVRCDECIQMPNYWVFLRFGQEGWFLEGNRSAYPFLEMTPENADSIVASFLENEGKSRILNSL